MRRALLRSGLWLSAGLMAGRAAGFLREATLAAQYGTTGQADVAVLMLTVPDLLVNVLVGGALGAVLIPEFKRLRAREGMALYLQASATMAVAFGGLALLLGLFAPWVVLAIAPGFRPEEVALAARGLASVFWLVPLTTLAGVSTAYLQAHERFVVPAFGTMIFNVVVIVGLVTLPANHDALSWLAGTILVAGLVRWLTQAGQATWLGEGGPALRPWRLGRPLAVRYVQALAAGSLLMLLPVVARAYATFGGQGALATLNYASKLVDLPLATGITVLSVVVFPRLAQAFALQETTDEGLALLRDGFAAVLLLSFALCVPLVAFSDTLATLAFGGRAMTPAAVTQVGLLAGIGLLSLPAQGVSSLAVAAFNANQDTRTPLYINAVALLGFALAGRAAGQAFGLAGLMGMLTATYYLLALTYLAGLRWRHAIPLGGMVLNAAVFRILATASVVAVPLVGLARVPGLPPWARVGLAAIGVAAIGMIGLATQPALRKLRPGVRPAQP